MDKYTLDALDRLIDYVYDDEHKDWEASGKPEEHIFNYVDMLSAWVQQQRE